MPVEFISLFGAIPERLYLAWHAGTVKTTETGAEVEEEPQVALSTGKFLRHVRDGWQSGLKVRSKSKDKTRSGV
jgi:hypothetical protein